MPIIVNGTTLNNVDVGGVNIQKVYTRQGETGTYVLVFEKGGVVTVALWFGGNWKMNKIKSEIDDFFNTFNSALDLNPTKKVVIFPPACYLDYVKSKISSALSSMVEVGIQNISDMAKGAFTGQISAQMAFDCGCTYALIGESEARYYLGVTDSAAHDQVLLALNNGLTPVLCVGEDLEIREAGTSRAYIENQLQATIGTLSTSEVERLIIVYEPIWAIGTGKTCSAQDANEMCGYIKEWLAYYRWGQEYAEKIPVCFGGNVKPTNINELLAQPYINGANGAGVSLKAADFAGMINIA
jgi:triosephosphate isomerase